MGNTAEYIIPRQCELCKSEDIAVRVIFESCIVRYVCLNCGNSRNVAKKENLQRRTNTSLNNWAASVIAHYPSCRICGSNQNLEAHHIIPVSKSKSVMYKHSNGMTLCHECHVLVHSGRE